MRRPLLQELSRAFPEKRLVVKPKTLEMGPVKMNRTKLNENIIQKVSDIKGVARVFPMQPISFPVRAEGRIFGQEIMTDIVINGVAPELVQDSIAPGEHFESMDFQSGLEVPVIISRYFLDLYNLGVAQANNLPQFSQSAGIGRTFDLVLGESTLSTLVSPLKSRRIPCRVVGFTPDVTLFGLVIPLRVAREMNQWRHGKKIQDYTLAHVEIGNVKEFERISGELKSLGLVVESQKEILNQFRGALNIISVILAGFSLCLVFIVSVNTVHSESLSLFERKGEIGLHYVLGMNRSKILGLMVWEKIILGFIAGILGTGALVLLFYIFRNAAAPLISNLPIVGNVLDRVYPPLWIITAGILFATLWSVPVCAIITRRTLNRPPMNLLEK